LSTVVLLYPIVWMVSFSFRRETETGIPGLLPPNPTIQNYIDMWSVAPFVQFFATSLSVAGFSALVGLLLGAPAAYAVARMRFRGRRAIEGSLLFSQVLPVALLIVPLFILSRALGTYDTVIGLMLVYAGLLLPVAILILRGFFLQVPVEIEEAALVDGASKLETFRLISVPLSRAGMVTTAIFVFVVAWEEYLLALTLTATERSRTVPIGLTYFFQQYGTSYVGLMATSVVSSLPVLLLFLFLGRYFVRGITAGAIKA
jgi:ABC-type glycerol-3-phosphate transport system permease component